MRPSSLSGQALRTFAVRYRIALLVVLSVALLVALSVDATRRALDVRESLLLAEARLDEVRLTAAALLGDEGSRWPSAEQTSRSIDSLREGREHLAKAEARLGHLRFVLPLVGWLPPTRGAGEIPLLIDIANDTAESGEAILIAFSPLTAPTSEEAELSTIARARIAIVDHGAETDAALARLEELQTDLERLKTRGWGSLLDRVPAGLTAASDLVDQAVEARTMLAVMREGFDPMFGFDEDRHYFIVGQNEAEVRPTGGFMGSVGMVTIRNGEIVESRYDRVEAFERPFDVPGHPTPPAPLVEFMGAGLWLLRDSNLSPDFPTTAEAIYDFLRRDQRIEVDGVVAFTTLFMDGLVATYGPLELDEYDQPLTAEGWRTTMERQLLAGGPTPEASYLHPIMEALLARLQQSTPEEMPGALDSVMTASRSRDLLFHARAPEVQRIAEEFGVAGQMARPEVGDFVGVVDWNASWSKVQPAISRSILYLARQDGYSEVVVRWENRASELPREEYPRLHDYGEIWSIETFSVEPIPAVFGNYVRIYLPPDATEVRVMGLDSSPRLEITDDFMIAWGRVIVRDGEQRTVSVTYRLPEAPASVTLWKQGGQASDHVRVLRNEAGEQITLYDAPFTADTVVPLDAPSAPASALR